MPQFDFISKPVSIPGAVGRKVNDTALRIHQQGMQSLNEGVRGLASAYGNMIDDQDDADMVASRSAVLRIKADEDAELSGISNPAKIKEIQERYKTKYDNIIGGNEPLNEKPYFRNQSGKDKFNKGFMQNFHAQRYAQGKDIEVKLNRRDTHAKYMNGIKSVIEQPNWNTPEAHQEVNNLVNGLVEKGFYTGEEAVDFRKKSHTNLDIERANKMFANSEALPFEGQGVGFKHNIDQYKEYVNGLKYLDQKQKNDYIKKADQLFKSKKSGAELERKDLEAKKKLKYEEESTKLFYQVESGQISASQAHKIEWLSYEDRTKLVKMSNERSEDLSEEINNIGSQLKINNIEKDVNDYKRTDDYDGSMKANLRARIIDSPMESHQRSHYLKQLDEGISLSSEANAELDSMKQELKFIASIDTDAYKKAIKDGDIDMVDELDQYQRLRVYNKAVARITDLFKDGKPQEASKLFREIKADMEKTDNDLIFFNKFINTFTTTGRIDQ
jgi:hypothetical protein